MSVKCHCTKSILYSFRSQRGSSKPFPFLLRIPSSHIYLYSISFLPPFSLYWLSPSVWERRTERDRQGGNSGRPGRSSHQLKGLGAGERHLRGHAELALSPSSLSVCLGKCYYFHYKVPERNRERIRAYSRAECETLMSVSVMIWAP